MKKRQDPKIRKEKILAAAVRVAKRDGYQKTTRGAVALEAAVSEALVSHYFGTMVQLRRAIMRHAVRTESARIVAQGLAAGDPAARKASPELRAKAAQFLAEV